MAGPLGTFLYGYYPYIVMTVFLAGSVWRFDHDQYRWRSGSSQLLRRRQLVLGSNLFHVGILVIFVGHAGGLLTPIQVFEWFGVSHGAKQLLAIVVGGVAGLACFAGLTLLLHRRLFDPRIRSTGSLGDTLILVLLYVQLILGLATIPVSLGHLDGGEMLRFMGWVQALIRFQPGAADLVAGAHWIFRVHLFLGLTLFLVFPFTRLVHIWSAPVWYLGRKGYQVVRARAAE